MAQISERKTERMLEKIRATFLGDTYDSHLNVYVLKHHVHVWNWDTNRCEHFIIEHTEGFPVQWPDQCIELMNDPRNQ